MPLCNGSGLRLLCAGAKNRATPSGRVTNDNYGEMAMTDAQIGLAVTTPVIIGFALMLFRMGVLQKGGTVTAVLASAAIATILFLGQ
jgi:hypothetical protein